MTSRPVALFAANRGYALASSRRLLIEALAAQGWRVVLATADDEHARSLAASGAEVAPVTFARSGLHPSKDLGAYRRLRSLQRQLRPRLTHCFHAKPVILGGLSAASGVVVHTITGLGQAFERPGLRGAVVRRLSAMGYRRVLQRAGAVIFQNPDDRELFLRNGWAPRDRSHLLLGSGVDLQRFRPTKEPGAQDEAPRVVFAARLLWPKGVREFVEAARILRHSHPRARFQVAGEIDARHPEAVPGDWLRRAEKEGSIELLGYRPDFEMVLAGAAIFALPSYYREGVPRVALEAAACGVPVVAADAPGCRETVVDGETGLLVASQDAEALARAVATLLDDESRRRCLGAAGNRRAVEEFGLRRRTVEQLEIYRKAGLSEVEPVLAPRESGENRG